MKRDELGQCLRGWKVRLRDSAHDVEEIQSRFYASKGAAAMRSLEKNGFAAHYVASRGGGGCPAPLPDPGRGCGGGGGLPHDLCLGLR